MPPILLFWWIDGCWWYVSTVWTFLPIFCYILLLQDRQQQRGSLTEWCLTWRMKQRCGAEFLHVGEMAPTDVHWHLLNVYGDQPVDVSTVRGGWCISALAKGMWKTSHIPDGHADFHDCGMLALVHRWWKWRANGDDYIEKACFVAENLLYQIAFLCSLYLS